MDLLSVFKIVALSWILWAGLSLVVLAAFFACIAMTAIAADTIGIIRGR